MGIDNNIKVGIYIECDGSIGEEHWSFQASIDERLYFIHDEANRLPQGKDFWGLNRKLDRGLDRCLHDESGIIELPPNIISISIEEFMKEYRNDFEKLEKKYKEHGISVQVKYGVISTYN